mmetsp:Transcript_15142/g.35803  ORF Transcript_15142/g.35803 Transcript_15142/m.35803 type:complete len:209 (-) Transcript_15142:284-910(-)
MLWGRADGEAGGGGRLRAHVPVRLLPGRLQGPPRHRPRLLRRGPGHGHAGLRGHPRESAADLRRRHRLWEPPECQEGHAGPRPRRLRWGAAGGPGEPQALRPRAGQERGGTAGGGGAGARGCGRARGDAEGGRRGPLHPGTHGRSGDALAGRGTGALPALHGAGCGHDVHGGAEGCAGDAKILRGSAWPQACQHAGGRPHAHPPPLGA